MSTATVEYDDLDLLDRPDCGCGWDDESCTHVECDDDEWVPWTTEHEHAVWMNAFVGRDRQGLLQWSVLRRRRPADALAAATAEAMIAVLRALVAADTGDGGPTAHRRRERTVDRNVDGLRALDVDTLVAAPGAPSLPSAA